MKNALKTILGLEVQKLLNSFCSCFGIRIHLFAPDGRRIAIGKTLSTRSAYCALIQDRLFSTARCMALDERMRQEAAAKRGMITYRCHAGLEEAVMSLQAGGHLLGLIMMGQFRCIKRIPFAILRAWTRKRSPRVLETAFNRMLILPAARKYDVLKNFSMLTN